MKLGSVVMPDRMRNLRFARVSRQGFVLAAVLWLLAGLSLVVALMGDSALQGAERTAQLRERVKFLQSAYSSQAQMLIWLAASRPRGMDYSNGQSYVLVNQMPYRIESDSSLTVQDHAGLIQLNKPNRVQLGGFLMVCGVPEKQVDGLIDKLEDYIDDDNLSRVNGAERDAYAQAKMSGPRNAPLLSSAEVWQVLGWQQYRKVFQDNGCENMFSVTQAETLMLGGAAINLSTAPGKVLLAAGLDQNNVDELLSVRTNPEQNAERSLRINQQLGNSGMFGVSLSQVSNFLNIEHASASAVLKLRYQLELLPQDADRPWYMQMIELSSSLANPRQAVSPDPSNGGSRETQLPATADRINSGKIQAWPELPKSDSSRNANNRILF